MKLILSIVLLAITVERAEAARLGRTRGGIPVHINDAPFVVLLKQECHYLCGGALITKKHVLTAAHCLVDDDFELHPDLYVVTSAEETQGDGTCYEIYSHHVHDDYDPEFLDNDVGILTLKVFVEITPEQRPIPLPTRWPEFEKVVQLYAYGSPVTNESTFLHVVNVTIHHISVCPAKHLDEDIIFCGITKGRRAAIHDGDSGSVLIYKNEVVGILSHSFQEISRDAYYMNVYHFVPYILKIIANSIFPRT